MPKKHIIAESTSNLRVFPKKKKRKNDILFIYDIITKINLLALVRTSHNIHDTLFKG